MTDILSNELVRKYFGCGDGKASAFAVICAMQEPIRKGERVLFIFTDHIDEEIAEQDYHARHLELLRLPDRFQEKKKSDKPSNYPLGEFDAKAWAKEFCERTGFSDEPWALSWFASAIMTGFDQAMKRKGHYAPDSLAKPSSAPEREKCACDNDGEERCSIHGCKWPGPHTHHPKPSDAVEAKIKEIATMCPGWSVWHLEKNLHELVKLALEEK